MRTSHCFYSFPQNAHCICLNQTLNTTNKIGIYSFVSYEITLTYIKSSIYSYIKNIYIQLPNTSCEDICGLDDHYSQGFLQVINIACENCDSIVTNIFRFILGFCLIVLPYYSQLFLSKGTGKCTPR